MNISEPIENESFKERLIKCLADMNPKSSETSVKMLAELYINKIFYGCTYEKDIEDLLEPK
uniref:Uncharacterized protein n=1 Tax=Pithovirus LCPAC403 TaxID=2506596 RepID=A0A481ZCF7_9VIRU|nr:MAG: hypothetical protein LCPAC403_02990 [Pithovirus LCPAC403]